MVLLQGFPAGEWGKSLRAFSCNSLRTYRISPISLIDRWKTYVKRDDYDSPEQFLS